MSVPAAIVHNRNRQNQTQASTLRSKLIRPLGFHYPGLSKELVLVALTSGVNVIGGLAVTVARLRRWNLLEPLCMMSQVAGQILLIALVGASTAFSVLLFGLGSGAVYSISYSVINYVGFHTALVRSDSCAVTSARERMFQSPKVSVCIPVYNGLPWIESTIESVLAQTLTDFEIVVRDDCSTDGTVDFLLTTFGRDARLRVIRNGRNLDVGGQYNRLFKDARGDFILKLDSDDLLAPRFLERVFETAQTSGADVVMAGYECLETASGAKHRPPVQATLREGIVDRPLQTVIEKNPFHLCFGIWRRSLLLSIARDGQFVLFTETCDWECQLRLALSGARFYFVNDVLGWYRLHGMNRSFRPNAQAESMLCDVFPYWSDEINETLGRPWLRARGLRALRDHLAAVARGRTPLSARIIMASVRLAVARVKRPQWCLRPELLSDETTMNSSSL